MKYVRGFFQFWYDFIIGDAWEVAAGVVIALLVCAALASTKLQNGLWLLLPLLIAVFLGGSLAWYARKNRG